MDYLIFIGFIIANSYFMYNLGLNTGKFEGMITITQFYKQKSVLKDKKKILGFKHWPEPIQALYDMTLVDFKQK